MSIKIPRAPDETARPLPPVGTARPLEPVFPAVYANAPSKAITPGTRVYPFAGLVVISAFDVKSARWRKDAGAFTNVALGAFTDILSASRFTSEIVNIFGKFLYEIELTNEDNKVGIAALHVNSRVIVGYGGKSVERNKPFRPFSDAVIASDPTQIKNVDYKVEGDQTIARTAIPRTVIASGTHTGASGSATLTSGQDFTKLNIRLSKDIVKNKTDGSEGTITAVTATTLTAILTGGVENDWDTADVFDIVDGDNLQEIAKRFQFKPTTQGLIKVTLFVRDLSLNESSGFVIVRVT